MTMMPWVAENAPELRLGRVDATEYNGLGRTFNVRRYPTVLLFDEVGDYYEFSGGRSPPRLLAFGRGAPGMLAGGQRAPDTLLPNVSEVWLLLEASYEPIKVALKWSTLLALAIKGLSLALLKCLERSGGRRDRPPRRKRGGAPRAAADECEPSQPGGTAAAGSDGAEADVKQD